MRTLPHLPQIPDANDPATPAVMFWQFACDTYEGRLPILAYRRAKGATTLITAATPHGYPTLLPAPVSDGVLDLTLGGLLDLTRGHWVPLKWRAAPSSIRLALFSQRIVAVPRHNRRIAASAGPMSEFSRGNTSLASTWRGFPIATSRNFSRRRRDFRDMAANIKAAVEAYESGTTRDERAAIRNCADEAAQYAPDHKLMSRFISALARALDDRGHTNPLELTDCGHVEYAQDIVYDHISRTYCESCAEDLVTIDGDSYPRDAVYYWDSDGEYHLEAEPEDEDEDEDGYPTSSGHIQSWGASTARLHHTRFDQNTHSDFTMGVELEVECESAREFSDAVQACDDHFNGVYAYAMFKRDGSLSDQGFEIVTAARRMADHIKMFRDWEPHDTLRAWKPGTCGVHVHIDSRAFSALTLGKFLMFINSDQNAQFITAIAGRHPKTDEKARSYCAQIGQDVLTDPNKVLKGNNQTRYRMVNLTNLGYDERDRLQVTDVSRDCKGDYSTVELRIFRASLKKERLLAQIEFSHAAVTFCRTASWHGLSGGDFKTWLAGGAGVQYKHLSRWFGVRVPKEDKRHAQARKVQELETECA